MSDRPNILIVMCDHLQSAVTRADHPCPMPRAAQLGGEGVRFDACYTLATHCCPARASFMTALYPTRHGVYNNIANPTALRLGLNPDCVTWSEVLRDRGYQLSFTGKWHVSALEGPKDRGWHEFGLVTATGHRGRGTWDGPPPGRRDREQHLSNCVWVPRDGWPDVLLSGVSGGTIEQTTEARQTADALEELGRLSSGSDPWCLYVGWGGPHDPYVIPEPYASLVDPASVTLPASYGDDLADRPAIYRRQQQLWNQLTEAEVRQAIAHYWGYCALLDELFGRLVDALDASGQAENTIVVFTSDHADLVGAHGLFLKGIPAFEEAYKIPFIVRWPGGIADPGREVRSIARICDFGPTFLEAAGASPIPDADGRSLLPLLTADEPDGRRQELYTQMNGVELYYTQRIMRVGRYKYVFNGFDFDELYDLEADPNELKNLINDPALEGVRRRLLDRLWVWARDTQDTIDNQYPTVGLVPIGPHPSLRRSPTPEG